MKRYGYAINAIFVTNFDYLTHVFKRCILACWFFMPLCSAVNVS